MALNLLHILPAVEPEARPELLEAQEVTKQAFNEMVRRTGYSYIGMAFIAPVGWRRCFPQMPERQWNNVWVSSIDGELKAEPVCGLPALRDVLKVGERAPYSDYLIYSNIDIAPMSYFYTWVRNRLDKHSAAFCINRRTLPAPRRPWSKVPIIEYYSMIGESHPGLDCFVFPYSWLTELDLGNMVLGRTPIGTALALNMKYLADRDGIPFEVVEDQHLTFHVGDTRPWANELAGDEASVHNRREYVAILARLKLKYGKVITLDDYWGKFA